MVVKPCGETMNYVATENKEQTVSSKSRPTDRETAIRPESTM